MRIDLHTHTTASDGSDSPAGLVRKAAGLGLSAVAVTDHDTVDGLAEALAAGTALERGDAPEVIPGVELTTDTADCEVHVLGLYVRYHHPPLQSRLERIRQERVERAKRMVEKVRGLGIPLEWESVWGLASGRGFVGRGQLFRAMRDEGLIPPEHARDAFTYFFAKGGAAYVPHSYLTPEEAIALIRQAGGVPVLAHPGRLMSGAPPSDDLIVRLTGEGLEGLEAYYPMHDAGETLHFLRLADGLGLIPTGGTDYHGHYGAGKVPLGSCSPPDSTPARLRAAAARIRREELGE